MTVRSGAIVADGTSTEVYKVGVKIPPIWPEDPELWFAQVEGQFSNSGITSDITKFNYVIGHLDRQFSKEVRDIIIDPPQNDRYEKLKTELIKQLGATHEQNVQQMLTQEEIGDRKLSQFLCTTYGFQLTYARSHSLGGGVLWRPGWYTFTLFTFNIRMTVLRRHHKMRKMR